MKLEHNKQCILKIQHQETQFGRKIIITEKIVMMLGCKNRLQVDCNQDLKRIEIW